MSVVRDGGVIVGLLCSWIILVSRDGLESPSTSQQQPKAGFSWSSAVSGFAKVSLGLAVSNTVRLVIVAVFGSAQLAYFKTAQPLIFDLVSTFILYALLTLNFFLFVPFVCSPLKLSFRN